MGTKKPETKLLDEDVAIELLKMINGIPDMIQRMGKDGKQIEAFYNDVMDKIKVANETEKIMLYNTILLIVLKARDCTRKFSFDPFKPLRLYCDDIARLLDLKTYKALRDIV